MDTSTLELTINSLHFVEDQETEFYFSLVNIPIVLSPLQDKGVVLEFGTDGGSTWTVPLF